MQYVNFGRSGMRVSRLAVGAMTFGRKLDEDASGRVIDEAIDHGINLIDTADSYGDSEQMLGRILKGRREQLFISTKVYRQRAAGGYANRNSRANIVHNCEQSLERLQTDYIDLYLLHHPDQQTPLDETLASLDDLVRQGKVRYVGVSNHYAWQMAYMIAQAEHRGLDPIMAYQCRYNILDRVIENEAVPFLQRFQVGTMIYSPLCGGLLSGKYEPNAEPPADSRAAKDRSLKKFIDSEQVQEAVGRLKSLASSQEVSLPQLATLWLKAKPWVNTILVGGSRPEHFSHQYEVADRELPEAVVKEIDELSERWRHQRYINQQQVFGGRLRGQPADFDPATPTG